LAGHVNASMPAYVVERIADALNTVKKALNGSRIHLFGVAYKKDVGDMRESPALDVLELLLKRGATVTYTDPWVATLQHGSHTFESVKEDAALKAKPDCVVICTDHSSFDYAAIIGGASLIVD
jgi:UDP-N-acetyl-D-glucosamine dehydrogenase